MFTLIKSGKVVDVIREVVEKKDILIRNSQIININDYIEDEGYQIVDAEGLFVFPGFIDIHAHFREPGYEHKETIKTGSMAAAAGGYTTVFVMPNTNPVIDSVESLRILKTIISKDGLVNILPIGAVTKGQKGIELNDIQALYEEGIYGLSDDGQPIMDSLIMEKALIKANEINIPIMTHSEDKRFVGNGSINEGTISKELGIIGISRDAENLMIKRDINIADKLGLKVHICHISTKEAVSFIRKAKKEGVKVTCEVTPHHFSLTDDIVKEKFALAKVNPPLRTKEDVNEIITGIQDGTIDVIATDHAPHSKEEKSKDVYNAPFGISGIELAFSITNTYLLKQGVIDIIKLAKLMSYNPGNIMGIDRGSIKVGDTADLAIVNLDEEYIVNEDSIISKGKNTPFIGKRLIGKVKYTIVSGKIVYRG